MASKRLLTILLATAGVSILMLALWPVPGFSFNRVPTGHPGLAAPANGGITGIQHGNTGPIFNSGQPTGIPGIKVNPHFPNFVCYNNCTAKCPGFRTPRDEQQCHQRCAAQCGG